METNETNQEQQPSNEPENTAEEIPAAYKEFVTKTANAANSAHSTRLQKVIDKKLQEKLQENNQAIVSQLKELLGLNQETAQQLVQPGAQVNEETTKFRARLASMEKEVAEAKAQAHQKEQEVMRSEEQARLVDALRSANVSEERIRGAKALLYTEDKRIGRDANGKIVFKIQRDGYEDEVSLSEGIAWWSQTDEGKHYLAPKSVAGSGMTGGAAPRRGAALSEKDKRNMATQALMDSFFGRR